MICEWDTAISRDTVCEVSSWLRETLASREQDLGNALLGLSRARELGLLPQLAVSAERFRSSSDDGLTCLSFLYELAHRSLDLPFCISLGAHLLTLQLCARFASDSQWSEVRSRMSGGETLGAVSNAELSTGTSLKNLESGFVGQFDGQGSLVLRKSIATNVGIAGLILCSAVVQRSKPRLEVFMLFGEDVKQVSLVNALAGFKTGFTGKLEGNTAGFSYHNRSLCSTYRGTEIIELCFHRERLMLGTLVAGLLDGLLEYSFDALQSDTPRHQRMLTNQYVQEKLTRVCSVAHSLKALIESAVSAWRSKSLEKFGAILSTMKLQIIEDALPACSELAETFGYHALLEYSPVQKAVRDLNLLRLFGGSREQQKLSLFRQLTRGKFPEEQHDAKES